MANSQKVSVIVPVHNTEKWLPRCLDCLSHQALPGLEILCIDDASTDGSWDILQAYARKDPRFRLLRNAVNEGAGASRNRGLDAARGEYVGFVDSDDFVFLSFYKLLYEAARGADIVKGDIWGFDNEKEEVRPRPHYSLNALVRENRNWFSIGFTSAIFKRELIKRHGIRFPEQMQTMEDPCFTIDCVLKANAVNVVDDAIYVYAENPHSVTCTIQGATVAAATMRACLLIGEMVKNAGVSTQHMPVIAFLAQMLQGVALVPDATDEDIRPLTDMLTGLYEASGLQQEFLYSCTRSLRKKIFAINARNEFFLRHENEMTQSVESQMHRLRRVQMLKTTMRRPGRPG
ncbi:MULTISPECIES: glycosyltransferase family 2 protein [unclassified Desulfovibrio]|uniref:glycosyltransferase family 2 protein n=1 Tax=unclassified Desulfovibrio TaxID=2593640 RepID=UPI0013EB1403|nr:MULTISPECIES: glycosyltransferase family 2 protein [unclassified Desulfovibrio]